MKKNKQSAKLSMAAETKEKKSTVQAEENLQPRPPVVVVLGHVDHGKTSILDFIRKSHVAEKEAGGITQHIGAYEIEVPVPPNVSSGGSGSRSRRYGRLSDLGVGAEASGKITFIDTPGHEAFSAMRSRGARVADIAILVVAAEEGIKPQTKEAILHIKKSGIPLIVAINKIDKPEADPEKVKRELAQQEILVESTGGKVPSVGTSAKTGKGIEELLELVLLVAEMENLKGDVSKTAEGVIVEAYLDKKRGPTATLLLRDGTLERGDIAGTGSTFGKVKILEDFQGVAVEEALPSMPCVVIGFEKVAQVGEKFEIFPDSEAAQEYIKKKERKAREGEVFLIEGEKKVLNLIIKADVQGSLEAIEEVLKNLPQEKVILRILNKGVGEISESDVKLAVGGLARILGFRVKTNPNVVALSEREDVRIMTFEVIYELAQAVRQLVEKAVDPERIRVDLGKLKVLAIFLTEKNRQIVGGKVINGEIKKGTRIEVLRNDEKVGEGRMVNLQKNKKDAGKAAKGEECGILYEGEVRVEEGDILQIYVYEPR